MLCFPCAYGQYNISKLMEGGRNALEYNDYPSAIKFFNNVIETRPQIHEAFYYRGKAKFFLGDYSGAEIDLTEVLQLNPYYYDAYDLRGLCRLYLEKYDLAASDYAASTTYKSDDMDVWYNLAFSILQSGQYNYADSISDIIINHWPNASYGYILKCRSCYYLHNYTLSETSIDKALSIDPYNVEALNIKARMLIERSKWKEAENLYSRILHIQPNNNNAHLYIDYCRSNSISSNMYKTQSIASMEEVINEGNIWHIPYPLKQPMNDISNMYEILPPQNLSDYKYEAYSVSSTFQQGYKALLMKEFISAISLFTECICSNPDICESYYNRSYAYARTNNYKQAISDLDSAILLNNNYAEAYYNRGILQMRLNNIESSRLDFSKAGELGIDFSYEIIKQM